MIQNFKIILCSAEHDALSKTQEDGKDSSQKITTPETSKISQYVQNSLYTFIGLICGFLVKAYVFPPKNIATILYNPNNPQGKNEVLTSNISQKNLPYIISLNTQSQFATKLDSSNTSEDDSTSNIEGFTQLEQDIQRALSEENIKQFTNAVEQFDVIKEMATKLDLKFHPIKQETLSNNFDVSTMSKDNIDMSEYIYIINQIQSAVACISNTNNNKMFADNLEDIKDKIKEKHGEREIEDYYCSYLKRICDATDKNSILYTDLYKYYNQNTEYEPVDENTLLYICDILQIKHNAPKGTYCYRDELTYSEAKSLYNQIQNKVNKIIKLYNSNQDIFDNMEDSTTYSSQDKQNNDVDLNTISLTDFNNSRDNIYIIDNIYEKIIKIVNSTSNTKLVHVIIDPIKNTIMKYKDYYSGRLELFKSKFDKVVATLEKYKL